MRILVAGGTGVLGRPAVRLMVAAGHDVTVVARSPAREAQVRDLGATPASVDIFDPLAVAKAVEGHDVVANLATHIPKATRMAIPSAWKDNDRIRTEGSTNLADAALAAGTGRFIQESICFLYADSGDEWITEASPVEATANLATALVAESNAARVAEAGEGVVGVALRFAQFYGSDSHTTLDTIRFARKRVAGGFGRDTYVSSVTTDDAAAAVVAALDAPSGIYNVADDDPVTRQEYCAALAAAIGSKPPIIPPRRMARLAGGRAAALARSQRVSNKMFREATGWAPKTRSVREGWPEIVAAVGGPARTV
jgi:2-alkyl-3-oxoalkanoate reductase